MIGPYSRVCGEISVESRFRLVTYSAVEGFVYLYRICISGRPISQPLHGILIFSVLALLGYLPVTLES